MQVAAFFDEVLEKGTEVKQAANWIMGDVAAHLKSIKLTITEAKLTPASLAELIGLIKDGTISGKIAKEVCHPSYKGVSLLHQLARSCFSIIILG